MGLSTCLENCGMGLQSTWCEKTWGSSCLCARQLVVRARVEEVGNVGRRGHFVEVHSGRSVIIWGKEEVSIFKNEKTSLYKLWNHKASHVLVCCLTKKKKALEINDKLKIKIKELLVTSVLLWLFLQAGNNSGNVWCRERSIAMCHCCPQCGLPYTNALPYHPAVQSSFERARICCK